jgi:hypothetical protein
MVGTLLQSILLVNPKYDRQGFLLRCPQMRTELIGVKSRDRQGGYAGFTVKARKKLYRSPHKPVFEGGHHVLSSM